jgi:tetratricopeptide (TPR) repeat protein
VLVDRDGNIWISDFGLAKHVDQTGLTGTGEVVGTLRYMAPEQLDGYADPRSDIYSLGLVLFELLTLTPACSESQYGPLICEKTIRSIPSPRSINAAVPRDLETITLKACALESAHRYQAAGELADDLRRFLEDRPIRARRTSPAERLWRWSRRNRLVAALSSVAVVLLAAVAVVFAVGNHNTNVALKDAVTAAVSAEHERHFAERNLNLAVRALDEIMQNISERGIPQTLHVAIGGEEDSLQHLTVTGADAALLKSLLHFFDEFASENRAYLNVQTATALKRIGAIQQRLGKPKEAEAAFQQSVSIYRQLAAADPQDLRLTIEMATAWNLIGKVRSQAGEDRSVIEAHKAALDVLESSAVAQASNAGQFELAETLILLGTIGSRTGGADLRARLRELHDLDSSGAEPRQVHLDEARSGIETDSYPGIWRPYPTRLFQRAATILQSLLERDPENPAYQFALAKVRGRIRMMPRGASDAETTEIQYAADESIRLLRQLVGRFPDSPLYTYELARTLGRVGQRCVHLELALREERLQESLHLANQLVMAHPQVPEYQTLGAAAERRLGDFAQQRGDAAGAAECYRHALLVHEKLAARFRSVSLYQIGYAQTLAEWAEIQRLTGEPDAARETLDKAISVIERSAELLTQDSVFQDFLDYLHRKRQDPTAQHHSPKNPFLGPSAISYPFPSSSPSQPPRGHVSTTK